MSYGRASMLKKFSLLCLSVFSTSCAYFSNENPPASPPATDNWNAKDSLYKTDTTNLPYLAWWKKFNDPTLNQLIESGLVNNNSIRISMGNVEAAQGELKRVELNWVPSLSTNAGYSSFPNLGFPGALIAVIPTPRPDISVTDSAVENPESKIIICN